MKLSVFTTDNAELKLAKTAVVAAKEYLDVLPVADSHGFHTGDVEADTIRLYPSVVRQKIHGFGGAFTESAAYVWATAPAAVRDEIIEAYFGKDGIGYNYGRVSIGSCDFSLSAYSYIRRPRRRVHSALSQSRARENARYYSVRFAVVAATAP